MRVEEMIQVKPVKDFHNPGFSIVDCVGILFAQYHLSVNKPHKYTEVLFGKLQFRILRIAKSKGYVPTYYKGVSVHVDYNPKNTHIEVLREVTLAN